ncbi:MAG TPA: hypothetical protein VGU01_05450 [Sphingomicrobium sp.]|nr:hypothetical protein [Sphingomicrobium sp.]
MIAAGLLAWLVIPIPHPPAIGYGGQVDPPYAVLPPLPAGWIQKTAIMDDVWKSIGFTGTNAYAFAGPAGPTGYASREDPASPAYQAWLGAYVAKAPRGRMISTDEAMRLAEADQRAWLQAMGDPRPLAQAVRPHCRDLRLRGPVEICIFTMRTHSDLGSTATPLSQKLGHPPASPPDGAPAYPLLKLCVTMRVSFDARRRINLVAYEALRSNAVGGGDGHLLANLRLLLRRSLDQVQLPLDGGPPRPATAASWERSASSSPSASASLQSRAGAPTVGQY